MPCSQEKGPVTDDNPLRSLPSVSDFLAAPAGQTLCREFGEGLAKFEFRALLDGVRECFRRGRLDRVPGLAGLCEELRARLLRLTSPTARQAINATGVLLHTGLGRAPLCAEALTALTAAGRYTVLQSSLDTGKRSLREETVERMLQVLTGCEAATVVNNNAAATMLILNTLAAGKEVIVSRGQLIEIGGAYRMMDVMAMSGCRLREVGCTNRTHLRDYENALSGETGALIHVHTSNYRIRGFSSMPAVHELITLGNQHGLPVIDDLGSGALVSLQPWGLPDEPLVAESIRAGAVAACFSGDKLICGPQAGILVGRKEIIARVRKNPFARMFRVCKLTLAALEATLQHFINGTYREALPFYRLLDRPLSELTAQAETVAAALVSRSRLQVTICDDSAYVGSGSIPDQVIASKSVCLTPKDGDPEALAHRLRLAVPPVFGRIQDDRLVLDMRTVDRDEAQRLIQTLQAVL